MSRLESNSHSDLLEAQLMSECGSSQKHDFNVKLHASIFIDARAEGSVPPTVSRRVLDTVLFGPCNVDESGLSLHIALFNIP